MGYKATIMKRIKKNNDIKELINQSNDLEHFFKQAEKKDVFNDFDLVEFFYRQPDIVLEDLKKIGFHFNINKIKSVELDSKVEIKQINPNQNEYRLTYPYKSEWNNIERWMWFYYCLGEFVKKQSSIDVVISYIDDIVPSLFISLGVIRAELASTCKENKVELTEGLEIGPGDEVAYLDGEGWRKATIIAIENDENAYDEKFNPYIRLKVERSKGNGTLESVPRTLWNKKIRISANYKKTSGSVVHLNDALSENFTKRYGAEICDKLKFYNEKYVNLVGTGIENSLLELMELFQFRDQKGNFTFNDFIYLSDKNLNYSNVNVIKSDKSDLQISENSVSIFVGSSAGLNLHDFKASKNVYLINRKRMNLLNNEILETQIKQEIVSKNNEHLTEKLKKFLSNKNVQVPKGCELIVY